MKFLNIFKYNLLWLLIWLLFWYDYCFKAGTHSCKFFPGIINIYNPTSTMYNFLLILPKNYFQKGDRALASVSTQFEIFLIFSWSQVWSLWDWPFDKFFAEFCSHAVVFWRFFICLRASWFGNFMTFASHLLKLGKRILVKNLLRQVRKLLTSKKVKWVYFSKGCTGNFCRKQIIAYLQYNK